MPSTYMNVSGDAVRAVLQFYRIEPEEILVVHDDLDLPAGAIRLKSGGGHAGHNGLRDIISKLSSKSFQRLRIGIGHPGHRNLVVDYVLGKPSANDKSLINSAILKAIDVSSEIISGDFAKAMCDLHI